MGKESKAMLKWRSHLKRGAIMKPSTFARIARKSGKAVAGAAYWNAAKAKFKRGSTRDLKRRSSHT